MKRLFKAGCLFVVTGFLSATAWAGSEADLEKRIADLEAKQAELYHSLAEKKGAGLMEQISENIRLGGLIEVEVGFVDDDAAGTDESDIALATVEIGLDADINERVEGHILLLYEEDEEDDHVIVDEGTITIKGEKGFSVTFGKMYVPFGVFNSHFISDPLTLELGETNETAILASYGTESVEVSFGIFNGDVDETGEDNEIDEYVFSITASPTENITVGASYISDIADTDADITGLATISDIVAGYSAFFSGSFGKLAVEAEYLTAAEDFEAVDLDADGDGSGDEPYAYNFEVAMPINDAWEVAVKVEGSDEFGGMPEDLYGVAASWGIYENTALAFEYLTGEFEDDSDITVITAQLAVEF